MEIFSSFTGETPVAVAARYSRYGDLKKDLAEVVIESLAPVQQRHAQLLADPGELRAITQRGAAKASAVAGPVYERAAHAMGLI